VSNLSTVRFVGTEARLPTPYHMHLELLEVIEQHVAPTTTVDIKIWPLHFFCIQLSLLFGFYQLQLMLTYNSGDRLTSWSFFAEGGRGRTGVLTQGFTRAR
jgi:hypothetical protein